MIATLVERQLNDLAHVLVVDSRLIQRVIKLDRAATGLAPHAHCYAIRREAMLGLRDRIGAELSLTPTWERPWLLLVAAPSSLHSRSEAQATSARADLEPGDELLEPILRAAFHALIHAQLAQRERDGALDEGALRERMRKIGPAEFAEIRSTFAHDDLLLPPGSDLEVYVEFCATYLELREFSPALLVTTFPGLTDYREIDELLAADVDIGQLLSRPRQSTPPQARSELLSRATAEPVSKTAARRLLHRAERALRRGFLARGAILAAQASTVADAELLTRAQSTYKDALSRFGVALEAALAGPSAVAPARVDERSMRPRSASVEAPACPAHEVPDQATSIAGWRDALHVLCTRRPKDARVGRCPEDRALFQLEQAVRAFEQPGVIVDVPSWLFSFGRRAMVRPREVSRELEVARFMAAAAKQVTRLARKGAERPLTAWLDEASRRAETNAREAMRARLRDVFRQADLTPISGPERQATSKLLEELLDQSLEQGFLSLPQLRDAVSRNEAKLGDVSGLDALLSGDSLLRADRQLDHVLDGVYRRGDVYLRTLQKASSLCFGNRVGRTLSLYLLLPALGAFIVLEGVRHLLSPILIWLAFEPLAPMSLTAFAFTSASIFALIHSEPFRLFARELLDAIGIALAWVFLRVPRAILRLPWVRSWLARPGVRSFVRLVFPPALLAAVAWYALPLPDASLLPISPALPRAAVAFGTFVLASATMASRVGWWLENLVVERLAPTWQALSRHWIPQLLGLVARAFSLAMERFEATIRSIDRALRFQRTRARAGLVLAGALGCAWAAIAYLARLYVTLLVEPELNPLKHFPVVTVAHKLILPFLPDLLRAVEQALEILGPIVAGTIAGVTVFLLPSVFGFLAWELKENYRLYRSTRAEFISPARLGPHGETMQGLLVPGLHSGTLPKLYDRLRRAAQRSEHTLRQGTGTGSRLTLQLSPELGRFRERLRCVEEAMRRFAERELLPALSMAPQWRQRMLEIERVELSSNRIRLALTWAEASSGPCELTFEHLSGWLVARVSRPGFVLDLDAPQTTLFENALAVFYHRAQVALVREQIEAELGRGAHYDVLDDGLLVWPAETYETALFYKLRRNRPGQVAPRLRGQSRAAVASLDTRRILYSHQRIAWLAWEQAWSTSAVESASIPRLLTGPTILPLSA